MDGRNDGSPVWRRDPDAWAAAMDIDLRAAMALSRAAASAVRATPGGEDRLRAALDREIAQIEGEADVLASAAAALLRDLIEPH